MGFWDKEDVLYIKKLNDDWKVIDRQIRENDDKKVLLTKEAEAVTVAEHKRLYPYQLKGNLELEIKTNLRTILITIPNGYVWNGADITKALWTLVGSQHSPEFKIPSCIHDYLLEYKWDIYKELTNISVNEYMRLTSLIFRQALKDEGVGTIKSNYMAGAVQWFQFTVNRKEWREPKCN